MNVQLWAFLSTLLLATFLMSLVTGIDLYLTSTYGVSILPLGRSRVKNVHKVFALFFGFLGILHLAVNLRMYKAELKALLVES